MSTALCLFAVHFKMTSEDARERNVIAAGKQDRLCPCQTLWSKTTPLLHSCRQDLNRMARPTYLRTFWEPLSDLPPRLLQADAIGTWVSGWRCFMPMPLSKPRLCICLMIRIQRLKCGVKSEVTRCWRTAGKLSCSSKCFTFFKSTDTMLLQHSVSFSRAWMQLLMLERARLYTFTTPKTITNSGGRMAKTSCTQLKLIVCYD